MAPEMREGSVLVVDDDPDILTAAQIALDPAIGEVQIVQSPPALRAAIARIQVDAVLLDMNFTYQANTGEEGLSCLEFLTREDPTLSVVCMTAFAEIHLAVEAMKRGAVDFVVKPWQNEKLIATLSAAISLSRSRRETTSLKLRNEALAKGSMALASGLVGSAPEWRRVVDHIRRAAPTTANVLILGETGTGKELTAREIHRRSSRASQPFVSVDMGAVAEGLFESELFGYKRGAFTGADSDRAGFLQAADGGTLFLDEIGNLSLSLQRKLLTVLERREVTPVGATKSISIDIRLISATNLTADEIVDSKRFRQDLMYRIKTIEIRLPPLRDRMEDIPLLLEHFLRLCSRRHQKMRKRVSPTALATLETYPWPGNIRELAQAVERAVILAEGEWLEPHDFALPSVSTQRTSIAELPLVDIEREAIQRTLAEVNGNVTHAAKALGLTRQTLYRRMQKFNLA
jgi:two-component system, NtrC family, response regulator HydG